QPLAHALGIGLDPTVGGGAQPDAFQQRADLTKPGTLESGEIGQHFTATELAVKAYVLRQIAELPAQHVIVAAEGVATKGTYRAAAGGDQTEDQFHGCGL